MKMRNLLSIIIMFAMVVSILPTFFVSAEENNKYVSKIWNGEKVTDQLVSIPAGANVISDEATRQSGFYVASGGNGMPQTFFLRSPDRTSCSRAATINNYLSGRFVTAECGIAPFFCL